MGIVNLTDDSFYSASRCMETGTAVSHITKMMEEGASIVDLGACSTRPGATIVDVEEEWRRLEPVLRWIRSSCPEIKVSIDTFRSEIVARAYELIGDFTVNDISAGEDDVSMLDTVGRLKLRYIAMHKRGTPETMQSMTDYGDVVKEVADYFVNFSIKAAEYGIREWVLDPGFGFAKTLEQNYELLRGLGDVYESVLCRCDGRMDSMAPSGLLVGVSRKSMIYKLLGITPEMSLPATQVIHLYALQQGADILRVHDVSEAFRTVTIWRNM